MPVPVLTSVPLPSITPPTVRVVAVPALRVAVPVSAIPRLAARVKVAVVARVAPLIVSCPGMAEAGTAPKGGVGGDRERPGTDRGGPGVGVGTRQGERAGAGLDERAAALDHAPDGEGRGGARAEGGGAGERDPPVGGQGEGRSGGQGGAVDRELPRDGRGRDRAQGGVGGDRERPGTDRGGAAGGVGARRASVPVPVLTSMPLVVAMTPPMVVLPAR